MKAEGCQIAQELYWESLATDLMKCAKNKYEMFGSKYCQYGRVRSGER